MVAVVFCSHSALRLQSFYAFSKPKLGKSAVSLQETADGFSPFASRRDLLPLIISSIKSDGNRRGRPPRKNHISGRTEKGDKNKTPPSSDGKLSESSNQDEIIALFRRIQSSISKGESLGTKKRISDSSVDKTSAESVLEILRQSRKQVKGRPSKKEGGQVLTQRRGVPKKDQGIPDKQYVADLKSARPPSNFVKRSPIPSPTNPRGKAVKLKNEVSVRTTSFNELPKVEEMKVTELKELAKSRGIKGYSKMKKSELVELLRS